MSRALVILLFGLLAFGPSSADAALPPFELVQKSVAKHRTDQKVTLDLRIAKMSGALEEFELSGTFAYGEPVKSLSDPKAFELRLLWIALLAQDPIAELQRKATFVNERQATVGVQDGFVYVYGTTPSASVYRDLKRLAALSTTRDGKKWIVRLAYNEEQLAGVMISCDGRTVLTARSKTVSPAPKAR